MSKKAEYLILFAILLLAIGIRLYISTIFYCTTADEFANIFLARTTFESGFTAYSPLFMWFYYTISGILMYIVKDAFLAAKLVTIIFGVSSIALAYLIAKKILNKKAALLSSFLLSINPEFTMISSTPLREPVYTFFILWAIFLLIDKHVIKGAFVTGFSFLTRVEGLLIAMPAYITSILATIEKKKRWIAVFSSMGIFILFIIFMNYWLEKPF